MQAWQCDDTRPVPQLIRRDVPQPLPKPNELVIRVHAVGVTPSELLWYPTTHTKTGEDRVHAIPGHEFSGVVVATVAESEFTVGQTVFGMNDWFAEGATAEFCCATPSAVAPKPSRLTHAVAASAPISALTAWQGLFDKAHLQSGERVLIHGGSGGVGIFAIQLARRSGAQVITTASTRNREFLQQLGAERVIDYHTERFEDSCRDVDVVFDTVGNDILQRSWSVLKPGGRLVTIASSSEVTTDDRTQQAFFIVEPHSQQLREIASLLDSNQLQCEIDAVVSFEEAGKAYLGQGVQRRGRGKTVVELIGDSK